MTSLVDAGVVQNSFSLSRLNETVSTAIAGQMGRMEEKRKSILSVNNHIKTQEEIEDDFRVERQRVLIPQLRNNRDGYLNIHNPERIDSGFMEENY